MFFGKHGPAERRIDEDATQVVVRVVEPVHAGGDGVADRMVKRAVRLAARTAAALTAAGPAGSPAEYNNHASELS